MIKEDAFLRDYRTGNHAEEATSLKWWILRRLKLGPVNADQIYEESECGDTAMYLALHELVINNLIEGISPYDEECPLKHTQMRYALKGNQAAEFFSAVSDDMAHDWDPKRWESCST